VSKGCSKAIFIILIIILALGMVMPFLLRLWQ